MMEEVLELLVDGLGDETKEELIAGSDSVTNEQSMDALNDRRNNRASELN
jgi:hypothetical protein